MDGAAIPVSFAAEDGSDATAWARFFDWLALSRPFPEAGAPPSTWEEWCRGVFAAPVVLTCTGFFVAGCLLVYLCGCRSPRREVPTKPSSGRLLVLAALTLACTCLGAIVCSATGGHSWSLAKDEMQHVLDDLTTGNTTGAQLVVAGESILEQLDSLKTLCPAGAIGVILPTLTSLEGQVSSYTSQVRVYADALAPMVLRFSEVYDHQGPMAFALSVALGTPLAIVAVICVLVTAGALTTRCCGGAETARCNDCCLLRLGAVFVALAVLAATLSAAVEVAAAGGLSSLCRNIDNTVPEYLLHYAPGSHGEVYDAARYYITGQGSNPLEVSLQQALSNVTNLQRTVQSLEDAYAPLLRNSCQGWTDTQVKADLRKVRAGIETCLGIVAYANIHPLFENVVHQDACGLVIEGLGWLALCQVLAGTLCIPALTCSARSFFGRWAAWVEAERIARLTAVSEQEAHTASSG